MADQPITGIPSSFITPGVYGQVLFAQGPSTAGIGERDIVLAMPMLSTGTWTANTLYQVRKESDASVGAGVGSPLHISARVALLANKDAKLWALPVAETTGGSPGQADGTITWATTPTGTGKTWFYICGERFEIGFDSSDTVTTIATAAKAAILAHPWIPVTADNTAGVLTITARLNGTSQGDGTTGVIMVRAGIDSGVGTTVATTGALGLGAGTAGVEGSTTEAAQLATALQTIDNVRRYYIVTSAWDTTSLANLETHIATKSEPKRGHRSIALAGFTGAAATAQSTAIANNYERIHLIAQRNSEWTPYMIAAAAAAEMQKQEAVDPAYNFDDYTSPTWRVPAVDDYAQYFTGDEVEDLLTDGVIPIQSTPTGSVMVMAVTTRSKNAAGTQDDRRALERHRISVGDWLLDTLIFRTKAFIHGKKLSNNPLLDDGSIDYNEVKQREKKGIICPASLRATINNVGRTGYERGLLLSAQDFIDAVIINIDPENVGRLEVGIDYESIRLAHQVTFDVAEVSPG